VLNRNWSKISTKLGCQSILKLKHGHQCHWPNFGIKFGLALMSLPAASPRKIRLGDLEVDLQTGELCRNGDRLILQGQPFQVLAVLLERPGELVTREELKKRLWPSDTFVDFDHSCAVATARWGSSELHQLPGDHDAVEVRAAARRRAFAVSDFQRLTRTERQRHGKTRTRVRLMVGARDAVDVRLAAREPRGVESEPHSMRPRVTYMSL